MLTTSHCEAGGATNFEARINYPNVDFVNLSVYLYGQSTFVDCFKNRNPEETTAAIGLTKKKRPLLTLKPQ